jgi:hypothetical protein
MKKIFILVVVAVSILLIWTNWSWRWVVLHGWSASKQAESILSNQVEKIDDEFLDYLIFTTNNCVVFSEHDEEDRVMVYCPKGIRPQNSEIGELNHLVGGWYAKKS